MANNTVSEPILHNLPMSKDLHIMITEAIKRAKEFLIRSRDSRGLWCDFRLPMGESTGWVTGFVGSILAGASAEDDRREIWEAWNAFAVQNLFRGHGGWGYNLRTPEDADSTVWGIRFAISLGLEGKLRTDSAVEFLLKHQMPDGGITTYILEDELRKLIGANSGEDISGWMITHICVTAAAATIPGLRRMLLPYLLAHQLPGGNWDGYWWSDTAYATALATEALSAQGGEEHRKAIARVFSWVMANFGEEPFIANSTFYNGSPFATALALKTMLLAGNDERSREKSGQVARWLISRQREDGSWQPSALLQVPPPYMKIPSDPGSWHKGKGSAWGSVVTDHNALFTTAAVLDSLVCCLNR